MLTILNQLPERILEYDANRLHEILSGPTLIHIQGVVKIPVFISVLLHGNEHSGWQAIRQLLTNKSGILPRSISLFIGNVSAAKFNVRHLPEQLDYNRIWNHHGDSAEYTMVRQVLDEMKIRNVFAAIDIHNNTGSNPHYACINNLDDEFKCFARLFSPLIVYFKQPDSVLSIAFSSLCPTVTVECGLSGDQLGIQRVVSFIENTLSMRAITDTSTEAELISIYQTVAVIKIPVNVSIGFTENETDIQFDENLEQFNFREMLQQTRFAKIASTGKGRIMAIDDNGHDVTDSYFEHTDKFIITRQKIIPAMITQNINIIKNDCLCYLMKQIR